MNPNLLAVKRVLGLACAAALVCILSGISIKPTLAVTPTPPPLEVLRVYVNNLQDISRLTSGGWDVLEARGPNYLLVMGNETIAALLQARGYSVAVDQTINPTGPHAPFTYAGGYHSITEHYQHMDSIAALHPDLALTVTYGLSWARLQNAANGYDLRAICITKMRPGDCALNPNTDKPRFFLMAAIHARELTTAELAWRWIDLLVNGYDVDPDITALLNDSEFWVVPLANPDGRAIVEQGGLSPYMQRKNVNPTDAYNQSVTCSSGSDPGLVYDQYGIDLNRNASFKWGYSGVSSYPCDQTYLGSSQASEPEEQALETLMSHLFRPQRGPLDTDASPITTTGAMLTLHSYSNLVLLPWGWPQCTTVPCELNYRAPNDTGLRALAFRMSYFNGYLTGQPSEALYAASGTSDDWAYAKLGIAAFTFEVGPSDFSYCSGFAPPYDCQDSTFWPLNRNAFLYLAKAARQPFSLAQGPTINVPADMPIAPISATLTFTAQVASDTYGNYGYARPTANPAGGAEFTIDQPPWITGTQAISMTAQDGLFDSTTEVAEGVLPSNLSPGRHMLFIHARDNAGTWGPVTAQWVFVPRTVLRLIIVNRN